jgi:hypothetical protein
LIVDSVEILYLLGREDFALHDNIVSPNPMHE